MSSIRPSPVCAYVWSMFSKLKSNLCLHPFLMSLYRICWSPSPRRIFSLLGNTDKLSHIHVQSKNGKFKSIDQNMAKYGHAKLFTANRNQFRWSHRRNPQYFCAVSKIQTNSKWKNSQQKKQNNRNRSRFERDMN